MSGGCYRYRIVTLNKSSLVPECPLSSYGNVIYCRGQREHAIPILSKVLKLFVVMELCMCVCVILFIYLFIHCHLYSAFTIVQCSNALYRLRDGEIQRHTGQ